MPGPFQTEFQARFEEQGVDVVRMLVARHGYPHDIQRDAEEWLARHDQRARSEREAKEARLHEATVAASAATVLQAAYAKRAFWVSVLALIVSAFALLVSLAARR